MQGTNNGQGNQNNQKQSSLSWSQPPQGSGNAGGAKPISQVASSPVQSKISAPQATAKPVMPAPKKATSNGGSGAGRMAGIFAAGIVVGLVIGWGWFSLRTTPVEVATHTDSTSQTGSVAKGGTGSETSGSTSGVSAGSSVAPSGVAGSATGLSVGVQSAGTQVAVSSVSVSAPTWVVVFDNNKGKPGNALGAALFFPGQKSGTVELLRATVVGNSYLVGEYVDNGNHIFSKQEDTQVHDLTGAQMLVEFTVR
jgi:hypothetical protein